MNREQEPVFDDGSTRTPRLIGTGTELYPLRAKYRVAPEEFFTEQIYVVHTTQTPALAPTHECVQLENNVRLETPEGTRLTANVPRHLVVPAETEELCLYNLVWLTELPCLYQLPHLSRLLLVGLSLKTLPSLAPLSNLGYLLLENLLEMTKLPVEIGHAPKLHTLVMNTCPFVNEFPFALIEQLTLQTQASVDPHRIKRMYITRCGFNLPHAINRMAGMEELRLEYSVTYREGHDKLRLDYEFPSIGQSFTALHSLTVNGHREFKDVLPLDVSGLTSLTRLKLENIEFLKLPTNIGQLTALETLIVKHTGLYRLSGEIDALKNLKTLKIYDCLHLKSLETSIFAGCRNLEYLKFSYSPVLSRRLSTIGGSADTNAYWKLALSACFMYKMKRIDIRGACGFELEMLRHAFVTWPPRALQTLRIDAAADQIRTPKASEASALHREVEKTPHYWNHSLVCFTAFASALHARLGAHSNASVLDTDVMRMIRGEYFQLLEKEFKAKWRPVIYNLGR